jgi:hypothetical protein
MQHCHSTRVLLAGWSSSPFPFPLLALAALPPPATGFPPRLIEEYIVPLGLPCSYASNSASTTGGMLAGSWPNMLSDSSTTKMASSTACVPGLRLPLARKNSAANTTAALAIFLASNKRQTSVLRLSFRMFHTAWRSSVSLPFSSFVILLSINQPNSQTDFIFV